MAAGIGTTSSRGAGDFFEDFGNFNFKATGFAAGFSLDFLQRQAGFKQGKGSTGTEGLVAGPRGYRWRIPLRAISGGMRVRVMSL